MENLTEDPEHSNNLVIDTKHDSEPEDLSQTDSEESDRRSSKLDFSSFNGDHNLQVWYRDRLSHWVNFSYIKYSALDLDSLDPQHFCFLDPDPSGIIPTKPWLKLTFSLSTQISIVHYWLIIKTLKSLLSIKISENQHQNEMDPKHRTKMYDILFI